MKRRARRPLRRRLFQSQILSAAADRFRVRGYRATTLEEIAGDVGMSKATVYRYFRSKEQLLAGIFHRTMTLFEQGLASIRADRLPPDEELRRVIHHHVRTVIAERSFLTVFFEEEAHLPGPLVRSIRRRKAGYDRALAGIVDAALARSGRSIDVPPRLLVFALLGMSNWVYTWYRPNGRWAPEAVAEAFITLAERGYRGSPAWRRHDVVTRLDRIEHDMHALRPLVEGVPTKAASSRTSRSKSPRSRAGMSAPSGSGGRRRRVRRRSEGEHRPLRGTTRP